MFFVVYAASQQELEVNIFAKTGAGVKQFRLRSLLLHFVTF